MWKHFPLSKRSLYLLFLLFSHREGGVSERSTATHSEMSHVMKHLAWEAFMSSFGESGGPEASVWVLDVIQMWNTLEFIYNYFPFFMTLAISLIMSHFQDEISVELNLNNSISNNWAHTDFISKWLCGFERLAGPVAHEGWSQTSNRIYRMQSSSRLLFSQCTE